MILLGNPGQLGIDDVPRQGRQQVSRPVAALSLEQQSSSVWPKLKLSERVAIEAAVAEASGNSTNGVKRLGIARSTLYRKLDEYGIARPWAGRPPRIVPSQRRNICKSPAGVEAKE
jgi:DNA-binding NtrC family response regulator